MEDRTAQGEGRIGQGGGFQRQEEDKTDRKQELHNQDEDRDGLEKGPHMQEEGMTDQKEVLRSQDKDRAGPV